MMFFAQNADAEFSGFEPKMPVKTLNYPKLPQIPGVCSNARPHLQCQKTCRHNWHLPTMRAFSTSTNTPQPACDYAYCRAAETTAKTHHVYLCV